MRKLFLATVLGLVLSVLTVVPAYAAIGDPDSITIESVRVFQNLWDDSGDGDQLYVVEYKVMYPPPHPTEDPNDTFFVGIWDGAVLKYSRPLNYYGHNIISIYLTEARGLTWSDPYTIRVSGNPAYFSSLVEDINMDSLVLAGGNWVSGTQTDSRGYLQSWCVTLAQTLETSWGTALLTSSSKLNILGSATFKEAIPELNGICPTLFQYLEYSTEAPTQAYQVELETRLGARLQSVLTNLGTFFHVPGAMIGGVGFGIIFFILTGSIFAATGSVPGAIAVSIPFIIAGNIIGLIPLVITFVFGLIVVVLFGVTFILGRMG